MQGKVKHYNSEKSYGFIAADQGDLFFHISGVVGADIRKGDIVEYEIFTGRKGLQACKIKVLKF